MRIDIASSSPTRADAAVGPLQLAVDGEEVGAGRVRCGQARRAPGARDELAALVEIAEDDAAPVAAPGLRGGGAAELLVVERGERHPLRRRAQELDRRALVLREERGVVEPQRRAGVEHQRGVEGDRRAAVEHLGRVVRVGLRREVQHERLAAGQARAGRRSPPGRWPRRPGRRRRPRGRSGRSARGPANPVEAGAEVHERVEVAAVRPRWGPPGARGSDTAWRGCRRGRCSGRTTERVVGPGVDHVAVGHDQEPALERPSRDPVAGEARAVLAVGQQVLEAAGARRVAQELAVELRPVHVDDACCRRCSGSPRDSGPGPATCWRGRAGRSRFWKPRHRGVLGRRRRCSLSSTVVPATRVASAPLAVERPVRRVEELDGVVGDRERVQRGREVDVEVRGGRRRRGRPCRGRGPRRTPSGRWWRPCRWRRC